MTFQRKTAADHRSRPRAAPRRRDRRRRLRSEPRARGLHRDSTAASTSSCAGEGEITFRELLRALEARRRLSTTSPGLSYRSGDGFHHNPTRPVSGLEDGEIRPPQRDARVLGGYTLLGRQVDVIETSRGCTFDCSFCSIIEMRGRNFHAYPSSG